MKLLMQKRWVVPAIGVLLCAVGPAFPQQTTLAPKEVGVEEMFTERVLVVKGEGLPPRDAVSEGERRLMAQRAAKVVAQRNLVETLGKVRVVGDSLVERQMAQSDQVKSAVDGLLSGAHVIYESYDKHEGTAAVYLQLKLDGPYGVIANLVPAVAGHQDEGSQAVPSYDAGQPVTAPPPADADALIVDASGSGLRPALVNRILTANGGALFDPSKVAPAVLAKKGCGEYTDEIGKAKAILSERGAKNPIVVKVTGVQRLTDAQISEADSASVFAANQKTNFLEDARVVFVL